MDVLCASCALPLYFPPGVLGGRRCGDGGLRGVLPLEAAAGWPPEPVVAVDVGPGFDLAPGAGRRCRPWCARTTRRWGRSWRRIPRPNSRAWRAGPGRPPLTYVRPQVERNATFQVERMRRYAEDGYAAARAALAARRAHLTATPFGAN